MFCICLNKRAIAPIVALSLLLIVTVMAVITFSGWFESFSSSIFVDIDSDIDNSNSVVTIEKIINGELYVNAGSGIEISKIELAGTECMISGSYVGISKIDIKECIQDLNIQQLEAVIFTENKIISKKVFLSSIPPVDYGLTFVSVWDTRLNSSGSSNKSQISLPLETSGNGGIYNFTVDWGDGTIENVTLYSERLHNYNTPGIYTIKINGLIKGFNFINGGDNLKLLDIKNWGSLNLGFRNSYFVGCSNLIVSATDALDLTGTTNLYSMFYGATNLTGDFNNWDVSEVTNMGLMFRNTLNFNSNLNLWNVSKVVAMSEMFRGTTSFNGDITSWKPYNVTNMFGMFYNSAVFNRNLSSWNVSTVTNCGSFDGVTPAWNLPKPTFTSC